MLGVPTGALRACAALAGTCLLAGAAWAQASKGECSDPALPTPHCAAQTFAENNETIAVLYADVRRALSAHERSQLVREHNAWLRARALSCPAPPKSAATADALVHHHTCLTRETQARRQGLMRWLSMDSPAALP